MWDEIKFYFDSDSKDEQFPNFIKEDYCKNDFLFEWTMDTTQTLKRMQQEENNSPIFSPFETEFSRNNSDVLALRPISAPFNVKYSLNELTLKDVDDKITMKKIKSKNLKFKNSDVEAKSSKSKSSDSDTNDQNEPTNLQINQDFLKRRRFNKNHDRGMPSFNVIPILSSVILDKNSNSVFLIPSSQLY